MCVYVLPLHNVCVYVLPFFIAVYQLKGYSVHLNITIIYFIYPSRSTGGLQPLLGCATPWNGYQLTAELQMYTDIVMYTDIMILLYGPVGWLISYAEVPYLQNQGFKLSLWLVECAPYSPYVGIL